MKKCNKCGLIKDESEFYRRKDTVTGLKGTCKPCDLAVKSVYKLTPKSLEIARLSAARDRFKNPQRRKASIAVMNAIASGKLIKQPCFSCGDLNSHAHHADYDNPLGVTWLCKKHHVEVHNMAREMRCAHA